MTSHGTSEPDGQFSVRQVSDMLDLSPRQIRALVADGALTPTIGARGKFLFSFQDLVVLRSVAELIRSGVALPKVRAAVASLLDQLPDDASLTAASLDASGTSVVVSVDTTTWDPVTRQLVLDLDIGATTHRITSVADVSPPAANERTATEWYVYADEIESSDPLAAEEAYRRALEIDSTLAEAHLNLGRLLHADGKVEEALDEYRAARTIDGKDAVIHYNIGVASQDLGEFDDAVGAYERAIELAPRFADARYNLSTLYEELGDTALAVQHLRAYRDLVEGA
ncbi:MAG: tetratricopeptide repeat protein [Acidimicrobiia bacterium]